jgi:hypothetical protein
MNSDSDQRTAAADLSIDTTPASFSRETYRARDIEVRIYCLLDRVLLTLGRDNALRRNYLRKRWHGTARSLDPRYAFTTMDRPLVCGIVSCS